jgi:hypothetical protein
MRRIISRRQFVVASTSALASTIAHRDWFIGTAHAQATRRIRCHAIVTKSGFVTESNIAAMLASANAIYARSRVNLTFELDAIESEYDAILGGNEKADAQIREVRQSRAIRYPGRLVIFFRPGPSSESSGYADYVVMGSIDGPKFAHESGHYFHQIHTHSGYMAAIYKAKVENGQEAAEALAQEIIRKAGGIRAFDGDFPLIKDTPPDPGPPLYQRSGYTTKSIATAAARDAKEHCTGTLRLFVDGKTHELSPDRSNIMSYFMECDVAHKFSPDQAALIERTLTHGNRRHLAEGSTPEGPAAVALSNGHVHVLTRGDDWNIWHIGWNGKAWSGWAPRLGSGTWTSGVAATAGATGQIHVFARGDDRRIWHTAGNGASWTGWAPRLGHDTFTSGAAAVAQGNMIHVFARGNDRAFWHSVGDGRAWGAWRRIPDERRFTSGLAACATPRALNIFARGEDRNIWRNAFDGQSWHGWQSLGAGTFSSGPTAVTLGRNMHVFARGDDRNVWHIVGHDSAWGSWRPTLPTRAVMSSPGVAALPNGTIHAFVQADDRNIWESIWNGRTWGEWSDGLGKGTFQV